jgi:hypothetical protein
MHRIGNEIIVTKNGNEEKERHITGNRRTTIEMLWSIHAIRGLQNC